MHCFSMHQPQSSRKNDFFCRSRSLMSLFYRVKKRFPTIDHVIEAGLMRSDELKCMEALNEKCTVQKWWMPLVWATNIVDRARMENRIKSDPGMQTILQEVARIRDGLTRVQHYDTISVPLVYTQVIFIYRNTSPGTRAFLINNRFFAARCWRVRVPDGCAFLNQIWFLQWLWPTDLIIYEWLESKWLRLARGLMGGLIVL